MFDICLSYSSIVHSAFMSPQIYTLKSYPPRVMMSEGGAFGRSWGWSLHDGIRALIKETPRSISPLPPCEATEKRHHLWTRKQVLTRHRTFCHPDHGLPASRLWEINVYVTQSIVFCYRSPNWLRQVPIICIYYNSICLFKFLHMNYKLLEGRFNTFPLCNT